MQKFVPRRRFGMFRNERTRFTPLDPKLLFCYVLYHLGAFGTVKLPYETRCKTGRTSAKVRATKSSRIFFAMNAPSPPHWTLNSCFVAFRTIWDHLVDLQNRCKTSRTSLKARAKKSRRNFSQRTHPMVRNTPKHEFRVQWGGSGAFVAKCSCHEVALEFFATNAPDSPH